MAQARQQYIADWAYVDKQNKEFTLTQEIIEKLDSIEPGAERNFIQGIKKNWVLQEPDEYRIVDLVIPEVIDELNSTDRNNALSARQGRVLYNYIKSLQSIWKFLSNWNSTTGMPTTNPSTLPYEYHAWDYYVVSIVSNSTNYRPEWIVYSWAASSTVETETVNVWDLYLYDGTNWLLLLNSGRAIAIDSSLSTTSTNAVENRVITWALNNKQEVLTAWNNIQFNWNVISATDTTYDNLPASQGWVDETLVTTWDKYNWDNKQNTLTAWANIQINWNTISATDTVYWAWANIQISAQNIISATDTTYVAWDFDIKDLADSTGLKTERSWKQDELIAWTNIQIAADWKTISATDTTYTAGTWISIDANNVISNTQTSAEWWNISWTLSDQTDLQTALDAKQDDMVILSYGNSTWNDFITAYNKNWIVYCRASNQANPATWSQTRLAFMAYVNNETTPTEVEFQYYRSRADHNSAANQLDQVFVYKLTSTSGWTWTVTERNTAAKATAWTWISLTYGSGNMTIDNTWVTSVNGNTWAVTVDESNTKTFYISGTSDLTNAQAAYDWLEDGNNPLIIYNNYVYRFAWDAWWYIQFFSDNIINTASTYTQIDRSMLRLDYLNDEITRIRVQNSLVWKFLSPSTDYYEAYTPEYNGSPATKKYVDDSIAGISWWITNDTTWTTTAINSEWCGTEAEYGNITKQEWIIYFTY